MPKYVLAYHGGKGMPESEEDMAALMADWGAWFETVGENLVDGGNPFSVARTIAADGSVADGGGPNPLTGYTVVTAADIDAAVAAAKGCPVLANEGSIEVCEAVDM